MATFKALNERQLELANEMLVAKDMIWRLTHRTCTLEKEVKDLKLIIHRSQKDNSHQIKNYSAIKAARIAEITRRRNKTVNTKQGCGRKISVADCTSATTSTSSSGVPLKESVKTERLQEDHQGDEDECMSDASMISAAGTEYDIKEPAEKKVQLIGEMNTSKIRQLEDGDNNSSGSELTNDSSDSEDDEESSSKFSLKIKPLTDLMEKTAWNVKLGRKKASVWKHFNVQPLGKGNETSGVSKYKVRAFCKFCKNEVSAKASRLRIHIKRCKAVSSLVKVKDSYKKQDKSTDKPLVVTLDDDSDPPIENTSDSRCIGKNITSRTLQGSLAKSAGGRKKSFVWEHYNTETVTVKMDNGAEISRVEASCKRCTKPISAKTERLINHWKKCHNIEEGGEGGEDNNSENNSKPIDDLSLQP